jgi:hypothetical protein
MLHSFRNVALACASQRSCFAEPAVLVSAATLLRLYVPSVEEATHPRCGCEGYPE